MAQIYRLAYGQEYRLPAHLVAEEGGLLPTEGVNEETISSLAQIHTDRLSLCKTPPTAALNELLTKFVETFLRHFQDDSFHKVLTSHQKAQT